MTRDEEALLETLASLIDGFMMVGGRPLETISAIVSEGFVERQELLDAATLLAIKTGRPAFIEDGDI